MEGKFEDVRMGGRGTSGKGSLNVSATGITWKKDGGSHPRDFSKEDIQEILWSAAPAGGLLRVRQADKETVYFHGFKKSDENRLRTEVMSQLGLDVKKEQMGLAGHNWGKMAVHGKSVAFTTVDGKHVFELPLSEVCDVQGTKEDAILEFHIDDAALRGREDALTSATFVLPEENEDFAANVEKGVSAVDAFKAVIADKTDTLAGDGDAIVALETVSSLFPRGRYALSLFPAFMDMDGQTHQFKIRYTNIERIYTLPRPGPQGNLVIVHLENAIRRGQTYYEWICFFFDHKAHEDLTLNTDQEFLDSKNKVNKANMELHMEGGSDSMLTRLLRGLSGAKVTKTGTFRASDGISPYLGCSYRNDAGTLYPLERAFLYTFKPELIPFDHIEAVEFERQQSGMHATSLRTFDLSITIRADAPTRTKHFQFRSIRKHDWEPLLTFLEDKRVRVTNLEQARQGPGFAPNMPLDGMTAPDGADEDDEDDDNFGQAGVDGEEDEEFEGSANSESDSDSGSDAELIAEDGISAEAVTGKPSKRKDDEAEEEEDQEEVEEEEPPKKQRKKAEPKAKAAAKDDGKKKKKKKDKNAPKRGMSAYMHFSNAKRDEVKADNPGIAFTDIPKKIAEQWKELTDEDKEPYNELAKKDKARYEVEIAAYREKMATAEEDDE